MYDLIVVGGGPAGYEAALSAAALNKKVLLVEKDKVGGTCLNYGCIPTKSLLAQTKLYKEALDASNKTLELENLGYNYQTILKTKDQTVDRLTKGISFLLKKKNVEVVIGEAILIDSNTIEVNNSFYSGEFILLALGAKSATLKIDGFHNCIDSKKFLDTDLNTIRSVVIIGGGVIGVEIATILSNLNIKVTLVEAQNQLILNTDKDAADRLKRLLTKSKVKVLLNTFITKIEKNKVFTSDKEFESDLILSCVGRIPNTTNFDKNNILSMNGNFIEVDPNFKTNIDNIYAVGDCVKGYQLAHFARACALNVVSSLFGSSTVYNLKSVPKCIYTADEIASIGDDAMDDDIVFKKDFTANARALIENQNRGFVKLIFNKDSVFKGATIMCPRASDMISMFVTALNNKLTIEQMAKDIYPHPSFVEVVGEIFTNFSNKE